MSYDPYADAPTEEGYKVAIKVLAKGNSKYSVGFTDYVTELTALEDWESKWAYEKNMEMSNEMMVNVRNAILKIMRDNPISRRRLNKIKKDAADKAKKEELAKKKGTGNTKAARDIQVGQDFDMSDFDFPYSQQQQLYAPILENPYIHGQPSLVYSNPNYALQPQSSISNGSQYALGVALPITLIVALLFVVLCCVIVGLSGVSCYFFGKTNQRGAESADVGLEFKRLARFENEVLHDYV